MDALLGHVLERDAKINNLDEPILVYSEVVKFNVLVSKPAVMHILNSFKHLLAQIDN